MVRIILDTDLAMGAPGSDVDDGFALALAHADPDISIEMITTVNGNTDVESATILTAELARRLGIEEIPIVKGAAAAFTHPEIRRAPAPHVAALAGPLPPPSPGYAAVEIARHVLANPGEITVVAIGPLTNVAGALMLDPAVASAVKEIVIMGGVFFRPMPDRGIASGVQRLGRSRGRRRGAAVGGPAALGRVGRHPAGAAHPGPRAADADGDDAVRSVRRRSHPRLDRPPRSSSTRVIRPSGLLRHARSPRGGGAHPAGRSWSSSRRPSPSAPGTARTAV